MTETTSKTKFTPSPALPPPLTEVGFYGWCRKNLFNTPVNSVLTVVLLVGIAKLILVLFNWLFLDSMLFVPADFTPGRLGVAEACRSVEGACWLMITENWRFILFGSYDVEERWRPALASIILILAVGFSCHPSTWKKWLLFFWIVVTYVFIKLIAGGTVLGIDIGLSPVAPNKWGGLPVTLMLGVYGLIFAFPVGVLLALGRRSDMVFVRMFSVGYIELIRGVPLITILFMASNMLPLFFPDGDKLANVYRALIGMTLFIAAYIAEIIRGGLQSLSKGQYEAADALGLSYYQKIRFIILPQALTVVIPPMANTVIAYFKDTSLVLIISVYDLMNTTKVTIIRDPAWSAYFREAYIFVGLIFFSITFTTSKYSQWLEYKLQASRKH